MALQTIVKNIYTFANILSQAGTDAVQKWNDKSLQNALNWAAYCAKVAKQTKASSFHHDLDLHIQSLTALLKPPSLLYITLESLCSAEQMICKRLLQNPHSPESILKKVLELEKAGIWEADTIFGRKHKIGSVQPSLHLLVGEDPDFELQPRATISVNILDRLLHISRLAAVSTNRMTIFLEGVVCKIAECRNGLEVLAELLLSEVRCPENHTGIEHLKDEILRTVIQISGNDSGIWTLDSELLCELSMRDNTFLEHHVQYILSVLNNMELSYGPNEQGELYTWRQGYTGIGTYQDSTSYRGIVEHVVSFVAYNVQLGGKVIPLLENMANKSYFNVYRDLLKLL